MRIGIQGQYDLYTGINTREAVSRIPSVSVENRDEQVVKSVEESSEAAGEARNETAGGSRNADISEIADRLKSGDGFSSIDITDRISSYNVQKAYSDIEMDESLKQYQYFVGGEVVDSSEDGIVIRKSGLDLF